MKDSLINKLNRDKENFQNCQKELLIIEGQALISNPPSTPQEQDEY